MTTLIVCRLCLKNPNLSLTIGKVHPKLINNASRTKKITMENLNFEPVIGMKAADEEDVFWFAHSRRQLHGVTAGFGMLL